MCPTNAIIPLQSSPFTFEGIMKTDPEFSLLYPPGSPRSPE